MPDIKKREQCDLPQQSQQTDDRVESRKDQDESCDQCGPSALTGSDKESERES